MQHIYKLSLQVSDDGMQQCFWPDILETSHSPSFFKNQVSEICFVSLNNEEDKGILTILPPIPYLILSPDKGNKTNFQNTVVWKKWDDGQYQKYPSETFTIWDQYTL
jgi:hypothetical protein